MVDYCALSAKCRAMRADMPTRADYERMSRCGSLSSLTAELAKFEKYSSRAISARRSDIEYTLRRAYYAQYEKLALFAGGEAGVFLRELLRRYEVLFVVRAAWAVKSGRREKYGSIPGYLLRHTHVDFSQLARAADFASFAPALSGTSYYAAAAACLLRDKADVQAFESICYNNYYSHLLGEVSGRLDTDSASAVRELIGRRIDIYNISYADRCARFNFRRVDGFIDSPYAPTPHAELLRMARGEVKAPSLREGCKRLYEDAYRTVTAGRADMGVPAAQLILSENELVNLTHITEGIRYGVEPDAVMEKIICR